MAALFLKNSTFLWAGSSVAISEASRDIRARGAWRWIYVVTAVTALYLNVFVLIVQLFQKVSALTAIAPTQSELPFVLTQLICLALFVLLGFAAAIRFRNEQLRTA